MVEVRDIIPDQMDQVEEGDELVLSIVDNRVEGGKGLLTVWPGKGMACIDMGDGATWGEWNAEHGLILTEEFGEESDHDGETVMGRIAWNTHGIRGILSGGRFYTLYETDSEEAVNT